MTNDRFETFLRDAAADYNRPGEPPREEMWAAVQAARQDTPVRVLVRRSWTRLAVGVAAALAVGIGIGRVSVRDTILGPEEDPAAAPSTARAATSTSYRLATAQHLERVETFLTAFQMDARSIGRPPATAPAARDLLLTTRLFLNAREESDPRVRALLEDIELVLAQIAQFRDTDAAAELDLIGNGIEQRSVLLRLEAATNELGLGAAQGVL